MTSWTKELDEAAVLATRNGCWHVILFYALCALASIPTSFLIFSQVFTNATPEHWCAPPPELEALSLPDDLLRNLTVPGEHGVYESCRAYSLDPRALYAALSDYVDERTEMIREGGVIRTVKTRRLTPAIGETERKEQISKVVEAVLGLRSKEPEACSHGWKYSSEQYKKTLVTKFNLVCDNEWLPRTSNTLFWVGSIFGNLFFGWISDRYGRHFTILLMIFIEVPLAIATSFCSTYWGYTILRVACGLFFPALYQQPFILALELMPPAKRTSTGIVVGMLFATGMCLLALLAYAVRDWYYFSLLTSVPFVVLYVFFWITPESPRWLVGRGRIAEAEKVFINLAKKNGIHLSRGFLIEIHKKIKEEEDGDATITPDANGHISGFPLLIEKDEFNDRRISNMLTFKPDPKPTRSENKPVNIERIIALEVAEIVNKKSRLKSAECADIKMEELNEDSPFNFDAQQKSTQTDVFKDSTINLRKKSVQLVNRMFKEQTDEDDRKIDEQNSEGDCKASPLDIFRYPNIRKKFFILTFNWVALAVVYNSLSYNTPNLGVDDYLAFFIGGAVEVPSYILAWRSMERFGRRWVLCIFSGIGGLACLSCVFVPEDWPWVTVSLAMVGRLCIASSFAVFYVQIGELLPTVLRAQAMGASSFIAGLGLLACPYIVHLAIYFKALPLTILGALGLMAGATSLFLPETLNQPLPQTLGDGEMFGREFKLLSCVERPEKDRSIML